MTSNRTILTALAWIGAAAAVLVAMFFPLPRAVLSEEEHAAVRMPDTRQRVAEARAKFERAAEAYRTYVSANDVGAALSTLDKAAAALGSDPDSDQRRVEAVAATAPVLRYLDALTEYVEAIAEIPRALAPAVTVTRVAP